MWLIENEITYYISKHTIPITHNKLSDHMDHKKLLKLIDVASKFVHNGKSGTSDCTRQ